MRRFKPKKMLKGIGLWIILTAFAITFFSQGVFAAELKGEIEVWSLNWNPAEVARGKNLTALLEIADEYMKLNPGAKINIVIKPRMEEAEINTWLVTQSAAETIYHVVWAHSSEIEQYAAENWFIDWTSYLNEPNPYIPGNTCWYDAFYKNPIELRKSPDGSLWSLPLGLVATIFFYNKDAFASAGVTAPETWAEYTEIQRKLKNAGYVPTLFPMKTVVTTSWIYRVLLSHFYEPMLADLDVLGTPLYVDAEEFSRAVAKGIFNAESARYKEILRIIKEWSQFWNPNFLSVPWAQGRERLLRKEATMTWDHCREMTPLLYDPLRDFEFGTFYCPQITKETSKYSGEHPMRMVGGASGEQWAITATAVREGKVDLCVDWAKFATTPENHLKLVNEVGSSLPIVKGCEVADVMKAFLPQFEAGISPFIVERFLTRKQYDEWFRHMQLFMADALTLDEVAEMDQAGFEKSAEEFIEKFKYDQSRW